MDSEKLSSLKDVMLKQGATYWRVMNGQFTAEAQRLRGEEAREEKSLLRSSLRLLGVLCDSAAPASKFLRYPKFKTAILIALLSSFVATVVGFTQKRESAKRPPNFVIIYADDLGYADIGSFGASGYKTPNLDRMAREGARLTDFYVAQAVCSASRAALFVSDNFKGKTKQGLYGDVIEEIDWSVGQVLDTLKKLGLDRETLVIFTSDNGPWLSYGNHAGSAKPLREGKATTFDGGVRVPFVTRWPGRIPAGAVNRQAAMTIDLLPTIARLAGAETPKDRIIDGLDIWPLLANEHNASSPHDALYFYWGRELHAVRSGKWKLHLPHPYQHLESAGGDGKPGRYVRQEIGLALFDLEKDIGETTDVAGKNPDVVKKLMTFVERARADLGDALVGREGRNVREPGRLAVSGK